METSTLVEMILWRHSWHTSDLDGQGMIRLWVLGFDLLGFTCEG